MTQYVDSITSIMQKLVILLFLSLSISACTPLWQTRPDNSSEALWQQRKLDLLQLTSWKIQGRTVIRNQQEAWNAGLRWQQNKDKFQIKLLGPFSQGGVSLEGNNVQVTMTLDDGQKLYSNDPEALITKTLGVQLPINALRDWIRGLPYQQAEIELVKYDEDGRIIHLVQQGWDIDFKRYVPFKKYSVPSKIFISQPDRSLRLLITSWKDSK